MCKAEGHTCWGVAPDMDVYKPPRIKLLRQLTAICLLLSALLWVIQNSLLICDPVSLVDEEYPSSVERLSLQRDADKGVALTKGNNIIKEVVEWFMSSLPSHTKATLQPSCPPLNLSSDSESEFIIISLIAIGDLHLLLTKQSQITPHVVSYLTNLSSIAQTADAVVTNLASEMPNEDQETVNMLKSLRATGIKLLSLANGHIHLNGRDQDTVFTLHALEAADIRWLGLNAKKHDIIVMRGQKVGFLAFCGVHGQCIESSSFPFAPLKYSSLVATNAVDELKEHGVRIIIVLMYWGKENSFFPDETALSIARHLAELQVSVIIGYHPSVVQDHAYFGRTLVLFSLGKVVSSDEVASFCWQKASSKQWEYTDTDQCRKINPWLRPSLLENEQLTRMYKIKISRSGTAIAEYITLPLDTDSSTTVKKVSLDGRTEWNIACGESDFHCLSCEQF